MTSGRAAQRVLLRLRDRGRITVLDRKKLEERVCECYGVVKKEFERLLPYLPPAHR